ncbi:DsbA family oxidoreductase [Parapedobacter sp. 10938]|uniref:DsbA family oxidoreductase n=1 Tax=Parapedobacter flavus TaxID=3110225 RepID=UPI002DB726F3|nr:DsbA family oxidoreductase [Parapedobacter sp. 10938]MEC3881741.1 DsbA family oxidoreductase [Parapedobacter sp. 10938]
MKIEIWSDIMCPFCYIGKRHLETALNQFSDADAIDVVWKSYQLDPYIPRNPEYKNTYAYLAATKGMSYDEAKQMTAGVTQAAANAGLTMDFERAVVANSFDAHRLVHLAQTKGLASTVKENLFHAHFTEGKDVNSHEVLIAVGTAAGLTETEISAVLASDLYSDAVAADIREARDIGVRGVPFFVFNRKYAVSGAQPTDVFLQTLEKSFAEWRAENPKVTLTVAEGPTCGPDGRCD